MLAFCVLHAMNTRVSIFFL